MTQGTTENQLTKLPLPRLQLTWEHIKGDEWQVRYELLVPVAQHDIRNEEEKLGYITAPMSGGTKVTRNRPPVERDGVLVAPFLDGAHAQWDAIALGIPAFVVYKDTYRRLGGDPECWQSPAPQFLRGKS